MKFGQFSIDEAGGILLAHAMKLPEAEFSKGHVLQDDDLCRIKAAGVMQITGARIEADDVGEDEAAWMLSQSIAADGVRFSQAATGRVNVYSTVQGVFTVERAIVDRFNAIDPAITFACLADHSRVNSGDMVATFKIIPLAVSRSKVEAGCALLARKRPFDIRIFRQHAVSLIATVLPQMKSSVMDKTARILDRRLAICGNQLRRELRTAHDVAALARSLRQVVALPDDAPKLIVIFGASAVIDEADVVPQAIREAGGKVLRVGMPVDPGNLMVLGCIGPVYVIGAPGCARSPKENGFDLIMERILTGENVDGQDIGRMGVGGLLTEIRTRPMPRDISGEREKHISVAIVIPAAGMSSRMGQSGAHKLLAQFDGIPLVRRTALVATGSVASSVTVVLGHREQELRKAISGIDVSIVVNADPASGMSSSLASGFVTGQVRKAQGVLIMLADMPGITTADLDRLIAEFRRSGGTAIVRASSQGKPGNPVILPKALQDAVLRLEGDTGARHLIETSGLQVINVEIGPAAHIDLDTPEDIADAGGVIVDISPADGTGNQGR